MSGPKKADVQRKLQSALEAIVAQVVTHAEIVRKLQHLGVDAAQEARETAETALSDAERLPAELEREAPQQIAAIQDYVDLARVAFAAGKDALVRAEQLRQEVVECQAQARLEMERLVEEGALLGLAIQNKAHYLHQEDAKANELRVRADAAMERQRAGGRMAEQAVDLVKKARNDFHRAVGFLAQRSEEIERLGDVLSERRKLAQIAEQQHREAAQLHVELSRYRAELLRLPHASLLPGAWDQLERPVQDFDELFQRGNYAEILQKRGLVEQVRGVLQNLERRIRERAEELQSARNNLQVAQQEIQGMDLPLIEEWGGNSTALREGKAKLDAAHAEILRENASEAQRLAAEGVDCLRRLQDAAQSNRAKFQQRDEISQAIMQALYDQNYDTPEWYFAEKDSRGMDRVLGDIVIFAKAPGAQGDMRMQIDLSGHVNLEVQNISEGQEHICQQLILNLQEGLGDAVDFRMVDWGRAAQATQTVLKIPLREKTKQHEKRKEKGSASQ